MPARYHAIRRFCPYQGVIQIVDCGTAQAYSTDGQHWRIRVRRPGAAGDALLEALEQRPPLPFPLADRIELWLLDHSRRQPLALVKSRCNLREMDAVSDPLWRPFLVSQQGFRCQALEEDAQRTPPGARPPRAQDVLERRVNRAARPLPVLQWFERLEDGSGIGHDGLRVDDSLYGRELPAAAFPPLLVREDWEDPLSCALVQDYHAWQAPLLLAHQNLDRDTRQRLETAACQRPEALAANYHMYPEVLDGEALQVALVSARLMQSR
ncbi:hypothetical protein QVG61_13445 [Thiohalobacter sp. IOR34]|uniref:hypothetical protein n=1 Tax=Thiohalobacter sp. IOR34 TaxID=3057176 RepID=UPI0025B127BC|nr:hypothetical protein [Thiohalobacter sp. IOR34]WJW75475.1 hypothetical protein QVG61_13445 [Thiohalobacter sp. IOR34]